MRSSILSSSAALFVVFAISFLHSIRTSNGFLTQAPGCTVRQLPSHGVLPRMSDKNEQRLTKLGFTETQVRLSSQKKEPEEIKVRVDIIDDIDPITITAIGFALIAINFLILPQLGDGGIAGFVASIINSS